jgi:phage tail-like protein
VSSGGRQGLDLPVGTSLGSGLPASFFGSPLTTDLVEAFDGVLAPIVATLDDLDGYLDPRYAPDDFVRWIGGWLGAPIDERWPADRVRRHLPQLRLALLGRGTVSGLSAMLEALTGHEPEITDSGGVSWSTRPQGPLPGSGRPWLRVRAKVDAADPDTLDDMVHRAVARMAPAHVPAEVTVLRV